MRAHHVLVTEKAININGSWVGWRKLYTERVQATESYSSGLVILVLPVTNYHP